MSNVACIPITEPFCQLMNTSEFMSQTHVQFMWALEKGQTEGKFYILSTHWQAMQKAQALEHVSKRACLLNPNQISELLMNSDSKEPHCNVITRANEKCSEKVLLEPNLQWQGECTVCSSAQAPFSPDITSVPPFYRQKEWSWQDGRKLWQTKENTWRI